MHDAYVHCEALVRETDKDRFLAGLFAPADRRPHLHALYAFNIEIARVGQIVHEAPAGEIRLQWWRDALAGSPHGDVAGHPVAAALIDTIARCGLPTDPLTALIDARTIDFYDDPVLTLSDLETYGQRTAGTILDLAARILDRGAAVGDVATPAGTAHAFAGLLRAFPHHAARGRVYLPRDVLDRHGVPDADIRAGMNSVGLKGALTEIAGVARARLAEARRGWTDVSPAVRPAFLTVALVEPLLARLDRNPDPFRPIDLPQWRRQWLLWRAAKRGVF
jgi:15-cis-phytoene synthase